MQPRTPMTRAVAGFAAILAGLGVASASAAAEAADAARAARYRFITIDVPNFRSTAVIGLPGALDDANQVVGTATPPDAGQPEGFLWQHGHYTLYPHVRGLAVIDDKGQAFGTPSQGSGYAAIDTATGAIHIHRDGFNGRLQGVNASGAVVGVQKGGAAGDLLVKGQRTLLKVPGATSTDPIGINDTGTVTGSYTNRTGSFGFTYANGTYTAFAPPNAANVNPVFIDSAGDIGGSYTDNTAFTLIGFIRRGGDYYLYSPPNAIAATVSGIGPAGEVVGSWEDPKGGIHQRGFIFDGTADHFYYVDFPGASETSILGVNSHGTLIGTWNGTDDVTHVYLAIPKEEKERQGLRP